MFQNASLLLGEDGQGFAYQTTTAQPTATGNSEDGDVWLSVSATASNPEDDDASSSGALVIGGTCVGVGGAAQGDVIGCYLDLDARLAYWTKNGATAADMMLSIAQFPARTVFFPACAIQVSWLALIVLVASRHHQKSFY